MGKRPEASATGGPPPAGPASFLAAAAALAAIDEAVRTAQDTPATTPPAAQAGPDQALATLLLLRELRTELANWEAPLVEAARASGATWADLAQPMGVASRQAAENRYLRLKPATDPGAPTGAGRVKAVRDRRAAERAVTAWARANAVDLRQLAAQVTALSGLAPAAHPALDDLHTALGASDAAELLDPLAAIRPHLGSHPRIAHRLDDLAQHTDRLRHDSDHRRA
ncbi:type III effector protein [Streptomyces sp. NPDC102437]|uniref:type III effector protein n=1 Tax=Streptomyces sp. NPDC102437 TaxID=3366175 RepID=UPI0038079220